MNTQPAALLYNFNDPERLRQIRRYLNRQKVKTRIITAPEFPTEKGDRSAQSPFLNMF